MTRFQSELHRLFLPRDGAAAHSGTAAGGEPAASGGNELTRVLVLGMLRPLEGEAIARVWRGVQTDLGLPAPAVAVNGVDGLQLWFSFDAPIGAGVGHAFLQGLRQRFLASLPVERLRMSTRVVPPSSGAIAPDALAKPATLPGAEALPDQWSAFIKPDLASLFVDTPWLDLAPNPEGQADLLVPLRGIDAKAFSTALSALGLQPSAAREAHAQAVDGRRAQASDPVADGGEGPEDFLLRVMRDETAPLALRVEAARALLAHGARGTTAQP